MRFSETAIPGLRVIDLDCLGDERGFFARAWCGREFREAGLEDSLSQVNVSVNLRAGTVRGLHFQEPPFSEAKVVRCTAGAIFDVAVDLRDNSATRGQWFGVELNDSNYRSLFVPKGFAHGFQTLRDRTEILYLMSDAYVPGAGRGLRYDDPEIQVKWPMEVSVVSDKDRAFPTLREFDSGVRECGNRAQFTT